MLRNLIPGKNGNNECYASMSNTLGIKFNEGKNNTEIPINDHLKIMDMWIPRNNLYSSKFELFDVNKTKNKINSFKKSFVINQSNSSLHINLSPTNLTIGYFVDLYSKDISQITELMCPKGNLILIKKKSIYNLNIGKFFNFF